MLSYFWETAKAQAANHQEDVAAMEADRKWIKETRHLPASDETNLPAGIKALSATCHTALGNPAAVREANLKSLIEPLEERLAQMESDFTKAERASDAKTVLNYREGLPGKN